MAAIPTPQSGYALSQGGAAIGILVPENERALRLVVVDARYGLLDGSRFPSVTQAEQTVARMAHFVDHPARAA